MACYPLLILLAFIFFFFASRQVSAQNATIYFPSDNTSLNWSNSNSSSNVRTYFYPRNLEVRVLLLTDAMPKVYGSFFSYALTFYCNWGITDRCLLAVVLLESTGGTVLTRRSTQVVWMANRNKLVRDKAILRAEPVKGLVLTESDHDRGHVWSTNMSGDAISGMTLRGDGNLVLFAKNGSIRWSSFQHHCDTLVIGQVLKRGEKLISKVSNTNYMEGKFEVLVTASVMVGFVKYKPKVAYLKIAPNTQPSKTAKLKHVLFGIGNITFIYKDGKRYEPEAKGTTSLSTIQIMRLDPDGGLKVYVWDLGHSWKPILVEQFSGDECQVPLTCGPYGVCTNQGCSCPISSDGSQYFTPDQNFPSTGCNYLYHNSTHNSLSSPSYKLVDFGNLSYFSYMDRGAAIAGLIELAACKQKCADNSTCNAAFFTYESNSSQGLCYLLSEVLSIRKDQLKIGMKNSVASIKVPILSNPPSSKFDANDSKFSLSSPIGKALAGITSVVICVMLLLAIWWSIRRKKCHGKDCFEQIPGAPTRFSFKELCSATEKFSTKLGKGGYGTVFKGEQKNGTPVAVKRLDHVDQGMGEFLAEMKTMGNIHHLNLVKLLGFCADEMNQLIVYEYMSNGSLDKWIFSGERRKELNWETRRRIILDVARGLAYLHEECSQRIAHLDMKPHNILLDEIFNAKISDFGLARFIDRNQSHVFTGMKGTLGYLAPEWKDSKITVKVDIYSFGIVVLEVVSGRMNIDYKKQDSDVRLLGILQRKASEDQLIDIVDKKIEGWENHEEDIVNMIRIGAWCLNTDPEKRPPMSTVVKVLEGTTEIERDIEFKFSHTLVLTSESSNDTSPRSSLSRMVCSEQF